MNRPKASEDGMASGAGVAPSSSASGLAVIQCPKVALSLTASLDTVRAALAGAPVMQMVQGWLDKPEDEFRPGCVRLGWQENRLLVFAELEDEVLFTIATADNQYQWALGDVFEIFIQSERGGRYAEFHIAPNGKRMQLIYPDAGANRRIGEQGVRLEDFMVGKSLFEFRIWQQPGRWLILASVPSSVFLPPGTSLADRIWRVSFSRYDYSSAETPPVLSSTSPHRVLSFHRQEEWTLVRFSTSDNSLVPIAGKS